MTINIFGGEWRETTDKELEEREREERAKARRACLEKFDEQMDEILLVNTPRGSDPLLLTLSDSPACPPVKERIGWWDRLVSCLENHYLHAFIKQSGLRYCCWRSAFLALELF